MSSTEVQAATDGHVFEVDFAALEAFTATVGQGVQAEQNKAREQRSVAETWAGEYGKPGITALAAEAMMVVHDMKRVPLNHDDTQLSPGAATALHRIDEAISLGSLYDMHSYWLAQAGGRPFSTTIRDPDYSSTIAEIGLGALHHSIAINSQYVGETPADIVHTMRIIGASDPNVQGALVAMREAARKDGKLDDEDFLAEAVTIIRLASEVEAATLAEDKRRATEQQQRDSLPRRIAKTLFRRG